jgi:hypothetical protein
MTSVSIKPIQSISSGFALRDAARLGVASSGELDARVDRHIHHCWKRPHHPAKRHEVPRNPPETSLRRNEARPASSSAERRARH